MSEQSATTSPRQLIIDLGPVAVFVIAYNLLARIPATSANAVYIATGIFIATTLAAMLYCRLTLGRIPPVLFVTGVIITAFGGLTIALHNETFVKLRPTVANFFYAAAIGGSVLIRQNVWKLLFGHIFVLPDRVWDVLALRWAGFFFVMGFVAEYIRRTLSTPDWVNWHFLILYVPTLIFAVANAPLVVKHTPASDSSAPQG